MKLITLKEMLAVAKNQKFAVGAFNAIDNHFIDAIFLAAEINQSPIILNFAEVHSRLVDMEEMAAYIQFKTQKASIPVTLNLDHGLTLSVVERAINCGFSSIMFDGSHLDYEDNIAQTAHIVELCKARGISVEGELGAVGGDEGGALEGQADSAHFTEVNMACDFITRTGIDALAVAIGNSHGKYKGIPKLDFKRLADIATKTNLPLVLHGGSGLSQDDFKQAISLGIAKINFYTGMSQAALETLKMDLNADKFQNKYDHYLLLMKEVEQAITQTVTEQIQIFGSIQKGTYYA